MPKSDAWKGRTAYPRDVATKRHVDRVQDRLDKRVDLHGEKVQRLKQQLITVDRDMQDLWVFVRALAQIVGREENEEE